MESYDLETRRLILYHSLGKNFDVGMQEFERSFMAAEDEFDTEQIKVYLNLISDPHILPNPRLEPWLHYFKARQAFMYWELDQVEPLLAMVKWNTELDKSKLESRMQLLRSQVQARLGNWAEAQKGFLTLAKSQDSRLLHEHLTIEAHLGLAQAHISNARSLGGWAEQSAGWFPSLIDLLLRLLLLPLYLPLFLYLWWKHSIVLWKTALQHAADYSNWHIFQHYLSAYQVLSAIKLDEGSPYYYRAALLRAGLQADVGAYPSASQFFNVPTQKTELDYREAVLVYGRANLLVLQGQDAKPDSMAQFNQALKTLAAHQDDHSAARLELMLSALDLFHGRVSAGLEKWKEAAQVFIRLGDRGTLAEALQILYQAEPRLPEKKRGEAAALAAQIHPKVFSARLPNRLFQVIQVLEWAAPLLLLSAFIVILAIFVASSTRDDIRHLWQAVFSASGLVVVALTLFSGMVLNTLLGLIGLASVIFAPPTSMAYYVLDKEGLTTSRHSKLLAWDSIESVVVVERGLFFHPDGALSFCCLRFSGSLPLKLAGTTRHFAQMVKEIEIHSGKKAQNLRLRWYGGLPFILAAFGAASSFFLTEGILSPWLNFPLQAFIAANLMVAAYLLLCWMLILWIDHFTKVISLTRWPGWTAAVGGGLGILLVAAGVAGRELLFPSGAILVLAGGSLVFTAISLGKDISTPVARIILASLAAAAWVGTVLLAVFSLVPVFYNIEAYAYSGELSRMASQPTADSGLQRDYFTRMGIAAQQMLAWDGSYTAALGFLGNAEFFAENYPASLDAYTAGIEMGSMPDLYYCRALVYAQLKNDEQAAADYQSYLKIHKPGRRLRCQIMFQGPSAHFPLP